jgi:hypothetical protein
MTARGCEDRCSPKPPVRTRRRKAVETRGVWRRGIRVWSVEMRGRGRRERRMIGARAMKAKIW